MGIASPWTYFILVTIVMAVVRLPWFRRVDAAPGRRARFLALDGLRGFSAISVFAFHIVVTYGFIATGAWEPPAAGFHALSARPACPCSS